MKNIRKIKKNYNFLLYVAIVLYPHFKLKYMKFCFSKLYDVEKAQLLTKNDKKKYFGEFVWFLFESWWGEEWYEQW